MNDNGDCVTDTIEAGDYVMDFQHDNSTGAPLPISIISNPDNNQQTRETDGLFDGFKVLIAKILRGIQNTISKDARATVQDNINTLLSAGACNTCNLSHAYLYGVDLTSTDLRKATWCDGCVCAFGIYGTCGGCPSVDNSCTVPPAVDCGS